MYGRCQFVFFNQAMEIILNPIPNILPSVIACVLTTGNKYIILNISNKC